MSASAWASRAANCTRSSVAAWAIPSSASRSTPATSSTSTNGSHSPIYAGSDIKLRSGMALQVDVIPATGGPYYSSNIEDGIALADEALRQEFAQRWPEAWSRIQARRAFMHEKLGIRLKPEVLPFSNLAAHLTPYMLSPDQAMCMAGGG